MKPTAAARPDGLGTVPTEVGVPVGETAPDAMLHDSGGKPVQLRELAAAKGPLLLVFYRGGWCPFCNFQIRGLTEAYPEFAKLHVTPVAVSVDRMEEAAKTNATYTIPFPVLSDPDLIAHRSYRVVHQADSAEVARLRELGMDLERSSGRDHHVIAIPSMFVIDRGGVVRWAHADPDYKVRPTPTQIIEALKSLGLGAPLP